MPSERPPRLPFARDDLLLPPALTRELQAKGRVHRVTTAVGHDAWLITGYENVRALLDDDRLGRSHPDPPRAARPGNSVMFGGPHGEFHRERKDHARARSMLQPHFTARRMRALRPRIDELTDGRLDALQAHGSPADLHELVAGPLPVLAICELLGVPVEDQDQFRAWTVAATNTRDHERSAQGFAGLYAYMKDLVARKRGEPADDVISRMCRRQDADDGEIAKLALKLLVGGYETTVSQIGWGMLFLLSHPRQWRMLLAEPCLVDDAVEEVLRAPITLPNGIPRYARTGLEIDGVRIGAGELLLLENGAGNHDPAAFPDPDRFDVTRKPNRHLAFGHGGHYCVGAPLARVELQSVFSRLVPRFPDMRLAVPAAELELRGDSLFNGLLRLPVAW